MKTTRPAWFALVVLALAGGCNKDADSPGHPGGPLPHPVRFWCTGNLLAATQSFTVNATTGGTIEASGHSKVVFDPAAFITGAGAPVSGTVQVSVVEVLNIADMILFSKLPVGDNNGTLQLLKSGGELKITAKQGDDQLGIVPDRATVMLPGSDPDTGMSDFYGVQNNYGDVVWTTTTDSAANVVADTTLEFNSQGAYWFYYVFSINAIGWINCDTYPPATTTSFDIAVPAGYDPTNTLVWVVVPTLNAGVSCAPDAFHTNNLPIGYPAVIVSLAYLDGQYYSSFTNITIAGGITPSITYQPATLAQFEAAVRAL